MTQLSRTAGAAGSITVTTKNSAGQLITPVSTPTAQWFTDAGRTAGAVSLTVVGSGSSYTASWTAGQAPATPATRYLKFTIEVSSGVFDVDADDEISFVDAIVDLSSGLCTLQEAKDQLGKTGSTDDAELLVYIAAATDVIEDYCGAMMPTATVAWFDGGSSQIVLPDERVAAIGALTEYQGATPHTYTAVTSPAAAGAYTYLVEPQLGRTITRLGSGGVALPFTGSVRVDYTRGLATIPAAVNLAARIIVQHLWRTQNGGAGLPSLTDEDTSTAPGHAFALPNRARELLDRYRRLPGVA